MSTIGEVIKAPQLNTTFFDRVLNNDDTHKYKIVDYTLTCATAAGDNYCSDIYRVKIIYDDLVTGTRNNEISLIVKSMEDLVSRGSILEDLKFYDKEREMYFDVLPKLSKMVSASDDFFAAKCWYATRDPYKLMVFQDLKEKQYQMADRNELLDLAHCELVLRKIGIFHAASVVYNRNNSNALEKYNFGMFNPNLNQGSMPHFLKNVQSILGTAKKWEGYENIIAKLESLESSLMDRYYACIYPTRSNTFRVLNHGDLWVNNFMFRYDSDNTSKPTDLVFVDYQIVFWTSPGIDLNYFFNTSIRMDLLKETNSREKLIQIYYDSLSDTMKNLGVPTNEIPTLQTIHDEVKNTEFYGFYATTTVLPIVLMEKPSGGLDAMLDPQQRKKIHALMYGGKKFQEYAKYNLKRADEIGVLD